MIPKVFFFDILKTGHQAMVSLANIFVIFHKLVPYCFQTRLDLFCVLSPLRPCDLVNMSDLNLLISIVPSS